MAGHTMTPARRAALRKAQIASARKRKGSGRGGSAVYKARANKRAYMAKNQKRIASKKYKRKGVNQYKQTGLVRPNGAKRYGKFMKQARFASKMNIVHGKKLAKHNKKINKAIAKGAKGY